MQAKRQMIENGSRHRLVHRRSTRIRHAARRRLVCAALGQDSSRGTFSQRHASLVDQETEQRYTPLNHVGDGQAEFEVIDSLLSEEAVVGFEYGYSLAEPQALVLVGSAVRRFRQWRAGGHRSVHRVGRNEVAAHVGSRAAAAARLRRPGAEHSSARLERYLQLCADDNMQVAYCTTPANYFHVLRRQMHRNFRKPLI
jgi:2-oxoglutarate dehydrogenase E1 component